MSNTQTVTIGGRQLNEPGHICAFFESRDEEYRILSPYYKEGIETGDEVITIVDSDRQAAHRDNIANHDIDVEAAINEGKLRILTSEETYTQGGKFGATRMYNMLNSALADAKWKGRSVRTSGVMDWATRGHAGTEELMEYESRVNFLVPTYGCTLLCVYDLNEISGKMMMEILQTHQYIIYGGKIRENPYYMAPVDRLREVLLAPTLMDGSPDRSASLNHPD